MENTLKYALIGAAIGAVLEILPLDTVTGIDDWVEIGAALGAWVGLSIDWKARHERSRARDLILRALREALTDIRYLSAAHFLQHGEVVLASKQAVSRDDLVEHDT